MRFVFLYALFSCSATCLLHLAPAQNIYTTVELAAHRNCVFSATFLPNRSDKMQESGRIKAVGCWFESGWCVGALRCICLNVAANQVFIHIIQTNLLCIFLILLAAHSLPRLQNVDNMIIQCLFNPELDLKNKCHFKRCR